MYILIIIVQYIQVKYLCDFMMYLLYSFVPALFATNAHQGFPSRQSWNCLQEIQRKWPLGHRFIGSYGGAIQHGGGRTWQTSNINDVYNSGFLQTNHLETTNCDIGKCSSDVLSSSKELYFSAKYAKKSESQLLGQFIRNEAIQLVGRHHHWTCRTSIWNKQVIVGCGWALCVWNSWHHSLPCTKHVSTRVINLHHAATPCIPISPTSSACLHSTESSHRSRSSENVQRLQPLCRCHAGGHDRAEGHQI